MKGRPLVVPLLLFLLVFQVLVPGLTIEVMGQQGIDHEAKGVVISQVLPYARGGGLETEFVVLHNAGSMGEDMSNWKLCDERNCAILPWASKLVPMIILEPGLDLVLAQNATLYTKMMAGKEPDLAYEGLPVQSLPFIGPFSFANGTWPAMLNDGDYIFLENKTGAVVDAVTFGRSYQGPGWTGPAAPVPRAGWAFVRDYRIQGSNRTFLDTNSSVDWPVSRERRAEETWGPPMDENVSMELVAMRFPNDGDVLAWVLRNTTSELLLNTYEFTSRSMGTMIEDLAKKGVKVKVLIEGHPVGGIQADEVQILYRLNSSGCEVRLMGSNSSNYRPGPIGLDHAKYMVMDGIRTVVMSENLVASALGTSSGTDGNRGWGLAVTDTGLAGHLKGVFMNDWPFGMGLKDALPNPPGNAANSSTERALVPRAPAKATTFGGTLWLRSMETPDSTEDGLLAIINATQKRLYLEQLSLDLDWHLQSGVTEKEHSPLLNAVIDAARRGVEVKVLLDSNFLDTSDNDEVVSYLNEVADAEGLNLQARLAQIPDISLVHNKGMIADDVVLVSSINWVDSAVRDNREVGVAVELPALAELYTSYFMKDWEPQTTPPSDGPATVTASPPTSVFTVCGAMLVIVAIALAALYIMRRGR